MRYDYAYDAMGRLAGKSAGGRNLIAYTYDVDGNRTGLTDLTGKRTEYEYDFAGRLRKVYDNGKRQALYTYNPDGTIDTMEIGDNGGEGVLYTEYSYDKDKNLTGLKTLVRQGVLGGKYGRSPTIITAMTGQETASSNRNFLSGTASNHVYVIVDNKGNMIKVGVRGQPLNKNGKSPRANPQVSKFNSQGMNTHAVIVEKGLTRRQALALEQKITDKHAARNNGKMPSIYHQRPKPSVNTIEGYIKLIEGTNKQVNRGKTLSYET